MLRLKQRFKRLRKGEHYENLYTALDIGTEYIKALVVRREGRNGVVLGASRERQAFADMQAGVPSDIQGIIETCDRAMSRAEDMGDTIPGQAVIGIAGEQVKGFSTSVTVPRADPVLKINEVELMQTLQLVEKRAMREARHLMSLELGVPDVEWRPRYVDFVGGYLGFGLPEVEPIRRGDHAPEWPELWEEMTMVRRSVPEATW